MDAPRHVLEGVNAFVIVLYLLFFQCYFSLLSLLLHVLTLLLFQTQQLTPACLPSVISPGPNHSHSPAPNSPLSFPSPLTCPSFPNQLHSISSCSFHQLPVRSSLSPCQTHLSLMLGLHLNIFHSLDLKLKV